MTSNVTEQALTLDPKKIVAAFLEARIRERELGLPPDWALQFLPHVLPAAWRPAREDTGELGVYRRRDGLRVLVSAGVERDMKRWLHVSCSHQNGLPSWDDLKEVKDVFIGRDRTAYQVLPKAAEYVNLHRYVLHLWSCLDGDPLPDFTRGSGTV